MPLFWRVALANAGMLAAVVVALVVTPVTVSNPVTPGEVVVLVGGVAAVLLINLAMLRPRFRRLERLVDRMRSVDLLRPQGPLPAQGSGEVADLVRAFNEMLGRLERERRERGRRAILAEEGERRRIGHELHDEIGQRLTALVLQLDRTAGTAPPTLRDRVEEARELARDTLLEVRRVTRALRPEALEDLGLRSALASLCAGFGRVSGMEVRTDLAGDLPRLGPEAELAVYRVAQEALTNAARHAGASRAHVSLSRAGDGVALRVTDDGRGLGPGVEGGGIRGMRERALTIGGDLEIASPPGGGTEVRLTVASAPAPDRVGAGRG